MNTNDTTKAVRVSLAIALLGFTMWLAISSFRIEPGLLEDPAAFNLVDTDSQIPSGERDVQPEPLRNYCENNSERNSTVTSQDEKSDDSRRHASYLVFLKTIAARISEDQYVEAENELRALQQLIETLSDDEKYAFLE